MAIEQILFFEKNKLDLSEESVSITASQGDDYANFVRNRSNTSAWVTSGSVDADNTSFEVDFVNSVTIDMIALVKMNFKNYTVQYWNGAAYTDFSTPINVSNNTAETKYHTFNAVSTTKIKLIVTGTMTANQDKFLYQFIASETIGQLDGWPVIESPTHSRERIKNKMMSGKMDIKEQVGNFTCGLTIKLTKDTGDLDIIEELYDSNEGFLLWLCGGDENQFDTGRKGYRLEDFYLMKCVDEWTPQLYKGIYSAGVEVQIKLAEVVD